MLGLAIAERRAGGFICQTARPPRAIPPEYRPNACNSLDAVSARHASGDSDSAYGYLTWCWRSPTTATTPVRCAWTLGWAT